MTSSFIVVADRGRLRMFAIENDAGSERLTSLADSLLVEPRLKASEKNSDRAGARDNSGDGIPATSTGEQMLAEREAEKRMLKFIGDSINALLHEHDVRRWLFAAPPEVHAAILDHVDSQFKNCLEESIKLDLVNVPIAELAQHFRLGQHAETDFRG
jgi:hypothetical protein